jgi:hypothetical protein
LLIKAIIRIFKEKDMVLPVIGALASAIPSIFRTIQGSRQIREGNQGLAGLDRPIYEMPEEVQRQLALSGAAYADPSMPGQQMMTDQTTQASSNAIAASREAGNPFATIASVQANQQAGMQNIGMQAAQFQENQRLQYMKQLQQVAGYRDTEFQMNEFAPYAQKYNEYRDMIGAGNKNLYSGIEGMTGAAMNVLSGISAGSFKKGQNVNNSAANKAMDAFRGTGENAVAPAGSNYFGGMINGITGAVQGAMGQRQAQLSLQGLGMSGGAAGAAGGFINNNAPRYSGYGGYSGGYDGGYGSGVNLGNPNMGANMMGGFSNKYGIGSSYLPY